MGVDVEGFIRDGYAVVRGAFDQRRSLTRTRAVLALLLFGDVGPQDAPTRLVSGSHLYVPELLAPYGEDGTVGPGNSCRTNDGDGAALEAGS